MRAGRIAGIALAAVGMLLRAQEAAPPAEPKPAGPPKLEYAGKPLQLPYVCTEDEIQGFGLSCSQEDPCPVYLELADVEAVGATIYVTGNLHNDTTTFYSVLLMSEDGGKTWSEPYARQKFTVIDQIQFIDFQNGWISGQAIQTTPKDPFVLLTNDGGKTWRRRALFDDGRAGAIEQFHFDSKNGGALVLDRTKAGEPQAKYEYYESQTGGESWTLREVSGKAIKAKRIPARVTGDWRLRADPAVKAYRVEKQTAGRWQTVASFLIRAPDCVPPAPMIPAAPPTEMENPPSAETPAVIPARKGAPTLKKKQ